jgi:Subtilase family
MNGSEPIFRLMVKFKDHLKLPYGEAWEISHYFSQNGLLPFKNLLKIFPGLKIGKLFLSLEPECIIKLAVRAEGMDRDYQAPDFLSYYTIDCPYKIYSDEILKSLLRHKEVELAYAEEGPAIPPSSAVIENSSWVHQGYLRPAPTGIDAVSAWDMEGGDGKGLKFIDIEQGWNPEPEYFSVGTFPLITGMNFPVFKDHGEAVLGVILTQHNPEGGRGVAPNAKGYIISQWRPDGSLNTADAILAAISQLEFGDIILLEAQIRDSPGSESLWPIEIQDAIFDVIRLASALGVTVIEAGGNGTNGFGAGNDLDNYIDSKGRKKLNPLNPDFRDSGTILVAAATDKFPHTRIRHSNFGNRIDCYAWGEQVSTAGSHLGPTDIAINSYRKKIGGTSSAAAIIAGAAILVQSITETNHHFRLNPKQMRQILSSDLLGTPSASGRSIDRIGVMPDLKKIIGHINLTIPQCQKK